MLRCGPLPRIHKIGQYLVFQNEGEELLQDNEPGTVLHERTSTLASNPCHISIGLKEAAVQFVCKLYSNGGVADDSGFKHDVDLTRMKIFCQWNKYMERIPPICDALEQRLKRSVFQTSIWLSAHLRHVSEEKPEDHRWTIKDGKLLPIGKTLPLSQRRLQSWC